MQKDILDFVRSQRVGVIAVEMSDGSPHAATVHFACREEPLTFIFLTSRRYRKVEPLLTGPARASLVIGVTESSNGAPEKTFQLDGMAALAEDSALAETYFAKFPDKRETYDSPDDIFFTFAPRWWRYTDYSAPNGKTIISSDKESLAEY